MKVALLAEGVDRNLFSMARTQGMAMVALLAEGVDRNLAACKDAPPPARSPSSGGAWIEIFGRPCVPAPPLVALLAEGVDRNCRVRVTR